MCNMAAYHEWIEDRRASRPGGDNGITREAYIQSIRTLALDWTPHLTQIEQKKLAGVKLTYGAGQGGVRGVCYYEAWQSDGEATEYIDIHAAGEENFVQLAGTTLHELGHVLAGSGEGHSNEWKHQCNRLGLLTVMAAGQEYREGDFDPALWTQIDSLPKPSDGMPLFNHRGGLRGGFPFVGLPMGRGKGGGCRAGQGTRGGSSFGPGSGRMQLYKCACQKDNKIRAGHSRINATCNNCGTRYEREESQ